MPCASRAGWTLAELLVVIAVLAVLAGLLVPAAMAGLRMARAVSCLSNLGQVALAVTAYAAEHDDRLPAESNEGVMDSRRSPAWFNRLPPYISADDVRGRSVFQCAGHRSTAGTVFSASSPKSFKMNGRLDDDGRPLHYRLGSAADEGQIVLFIDAVAGETGMGQWGHATPSAVDDSRHGGRVNVLHLDGHTRTTVATPRDHDWEKALCWEAAAWK